MADPASITGLVYPLAKDLIRLAKKLRQVYHEIRHARESLLKMINRIETVAATYELFRETMAEARAVRDLAETFKKHQKLLDDVEVEAERIIKSLRTVKKGFKPLLRNDYINPVERWIAQFQWYRTEKKVVAPVLVEMEILEGSMNLITTLVDIKMLLQSDKRGIRDRHSIQVHIKHLRRLMGIGFKKLQDNQRIQADMFTQRLATVTVDQGISPNDFAQEVLRMLKREIPRIKLPPRQPPDSPLTPNSDPPSDSSTPRQQPPSTPPSSPPHSNDGGQQTVIRPEPQEVSTQELKESELTSQQQHPHPPFPTSPSPSLLHLTSVVGDESEQKETLEAKRYVPTALFGAPVPSPRPRAGRSSATHLAPSSNGGDQRAGSSTLPYSNHFSGQPSGKLYSRNRRQSGSQISVYGVDGEVTHTHLTGEAGLRPGWQRRKGGSSR